MTKEWKEWWIYYVNSKTPEGYFTLPLEPKSIEDLTIEEFDLLDASTWELITDNKYGIEYFLCKKMKNNMKKITDMLLAQRFTIDPSILLEGQLDEMVRLLK